MDGICAVSVVRLIHEGEYRYSNVEEVRQVGGVPALNQVLL